MSIDSKRVWEKSSVANPRSGRCGLIYIPTCLSDNVCKAPPAFFGVYTRRTIYIAIEVIGKGLK